MTVVLAIPPEETLTSELLAVVEVAVPPARTFKVPALLRMGIRFL